MESMAVTRGANSNPDGRSDSLAVSGKAEQEQGQSRGWIQQLEAWVQDLDEVCEEAAKEGWDGEGARALQVGARHYAASLVTDLKEGTRLPEVGVDPDGEISLGWDVGEDSFSVSISGAGRLSFAGLFGASDCHGAEWMVDQIPDTIKRGLDRLFS